VTVWFYDDIKDIIEICRVAAYLNLSVHLTGVSLRFTPAGDFIVRHLSGKCDTFLE